jgi:hypothetical protein
MDEMQSLTIEQVYNMLVSDDPPPSPYTRAALLYQYEIMKRYEYWLQERARLASFSCHRIARLTLQRN